MTANPIDEAVDLLEVARSTGLRSYLHGVNATDARELLVRFVAALTAAQQQGQAVGGWPLGELNRQETLKVLREHNAWRRGGDGTQTDPRLLGLALDAAIAAITAPPPSVPEGWVLVTAEPTDAQLRAMSASRARDDEGDFPALMDLIDYSGENKTRAVLRAAYTAAIVAAAPSAQEPPHV